MPAVLLYGFGLAAIYTADLLITSVFSDDFISSWAEIRALIGLSGILCLVGLDLVIMRSPQSSGRLMLLLGLQVPVLALPVALVVNGLGYLGSFTEAYLLAIGSAGTIALYQYFRSHHQRGMAQLIQQGWRIVILGGVAVLAVVPGLVEIGTMVVLVMISGVGLASFVLLAKPPSSFCRQSPEPVVALYRVGIRFMVTSSLLALAIYAEQLLVIRIGTTIDSARYFTHATFFLFPFSVLNGYLGFLMGPWVRENHNLFVRLYSKYWVRFIIAVSGVALLLNMLGHVAWRVLDPSIGEPSLYLSLIFATCGITITVYQIPSAYNGVFAKPRHHDALIVSQLIALAIAYGGFLLFNKMFSLPVVTSVAIASLLNWVLRTGSGLFVIAIIIRSRGA